MRFKKILMVGFSENDLSPEYWKKFNELCEQKILIPKEGSENIPKDSLDADCLIVKLMTVVDKKLIGSMKNLKFIGTVFTSYSRIDHVYAASKSIAVCSVPGYSTEAVAEFAFAVILEHLRNLETGKIEARKGNYSEITFLGAEIKNKKLGIIGLGSIGSRTSEIALGFGADVIYWSRNRKEKYEKIGVKYIDIDSLLKESDIISIHLSLNDETKNFLNEERIQKIKPGAVVINLAPMELVDMNALRERLKKGDITFIYDHSDELSKEENEKFLSYKNCIVYPPLPYLTKEARIRRQEIFLENLKGFLEGRPQNKVV